MKTRFVLMVTLLSSLSFVLVAALSAGGETADATHMVYLPVVNDTTGDPLWYWDDFSDSRSGWQIYDDGSNVRWGYQDGEYETLIRFEDWWAGAQAPVVGFENYRVEADMRRLEGNTSDYGLVFDWQDWDNFYFFTVDAGDQWFGVAKVVDGVPGEIVPRTDASSIKPANAINHLQVDRRASEIVVYVNGNELATANDSGFGGDLGAGLFMEADADVPAKVRYDNFKVWRLGGSTQQKMGTMPHSTEIASYGSGSCETAQNLCLFD